MLALIEKELKLAGIDYVILTGETKDREEQVAASRPARCRSS
jgi:SNF2 family DNA or RNA helicase